ncbi:MAG: tetratricopeptide repeat protein, partial [bacterium]
EAVASCQKALEIDPGLALAHYNLAVAYYYEKKYVLAIKHCDRAIELGYVAVPQFLELIKPYRK